jgi:metal-responsive CopG/Arc/MetJ family transcriptional regulator
MGIIINRVRCERGNMGNQKPMKDREDVTVPMPGPWVEQIDSTLRGTDSRSAWIREAIRQRLEAEGLLEDC